VTLLKTIRDVQQELLALSNHESRPTVSSIKPEYFDAFATAWHNDYRAPRGRRKTVTRHWWRTRTAPFAETWPLVESWLVADPKITAKELMVRLTIQLSDLYPTGAQLRSLQRHVKAWRAQWARQLVFAASSCSASTIFADRVASTKNVTPRLSS